MFRQVLSTLPRLPGGPPDPFRTSGKAFSEGLPTLLELLGRACRPFPNFREGLPTFPDFPKGLSTLLRGASWPPDPSRMSSRSSRPFQDDREGLYPPFSDVRGSLPTLPGRSGRASRPFPEVWEGLPTLLDVPEGLPTLPEPPGGLPTFPRLPKGSPDPTRRCELASRPFLYVQQILPTLPGRPRRALPTLSGRPG